jgi:hypothetical protein
VSESDRVEVASEDALLKRLLSPEHYENGIVKPEAFHVRNKPDNDISTYLASRVSVEEASVHPRGRQAGCGRIEVAYPRSLGLEVVHTPEDGHPWHCSIRGIWAPPNPRQTCLLLARATVVVKEPVKDRP